MNNSVMIERQPAQFTPLKLTININTPEMLKAMYCLFNTIGQDVMATAMRDSESYRSAALLHVQPDYHKMNRLLNTVVAMPIFDVLYDAVEALPK